MKAFSLTMVSLLLCTGCEKIAKPEPKPELVERLLKTNPISAKINVTTYRYGNTNTGWNADESELTPLNVNKATFGPLFYTQVEGQVYTNPLIVTNVPIRVGSHPGIHDVVIVATQTDNLYALDANNGEPLWASNFALSDNLNAAVTPMPWADTGQGPLSPWAGISSTPVIDPATNTIYLITKIKRVAGLDTHYLEHFHAINLTSGSERPGSPVLIADTSLNNGIYTCLFGPTVPGTGEGSINGKLTFNAVRQYNRAALTLYNGVVYSGWASLNDVGPYHGWILGFDATTFKLVAAFVTTPNGSDGGIWNAEAPITNDTAGNLFISTGNGTFDTTFDASGFPINGDYGDTLLKLQRDTTTSASNPGKNGWGLKVVDFFTPSNQDFLNVQDLDLASAGVTLLPDSLGTSTHPHLMVVPSKSGAIYLVDRDNLGRFHATNQVVEEAMMPWGLWGSVGIFGSMLYAGGSVFPQKPTTLYSYSLQNGIFSGILSQTSDTYLYPSATPAISSFQNSNGIVWAVEDNSYQLRAYDAQNLAHELFTSAVPSTPRFTVPTVANGHVYIGTNNFVEGLGLFGDSSSQTSAPNGGLFAIGNNGRPYTSPQNIFSDSLSNIWQTVDGGWQVKQIAAAIEADGRIRLFVIGLDDKIYTQIQPYPGSLFNGAWIQTKDNKPVKQIAVGREQNGRLRLFALGMDLRIYDQLESEGSFNAPGWDTSVGLWNLKEIAVTSENDGRLRVFAIGMNDEIYSQLENVPNGNFTQLWDTSLGGWRVKHISVSHEADGRVRLFAIALDDRIYSQVENPVSHLFNTLWDSSVGGWQLRGLTVSLGADGREVLFAIGLDNLIYCQLENTGSLQFSGFWEKVAPGLAVTSIFSLLQ